MAPAHSAIAVLPALVNASAIAVYGSLQPIGTKATAARRTVSALSVSPVAAYAVPIR